MSAERNPWLRRWPRWLRRGPLETVATAVIAAGVLMLLQPFSLTLYTLLFRHNAGRYGDVQRSSSKFPE